MAAKPVLLTFDMFGTVLDWRTGMAASLERRGLQLGDGFDAVVDVQGALEQTRFEPYVAITARSLIRVVNAPVDVAAEIGTEVGRWPLFAESRSGMRRLQARVPCAAMTNSDRGHGEDVQRSLGFRLTHWLCAEEVGVYKPDERFWHAARERFAVPFGPSWWHVSAYADYDLDVVRRLGLTSIFIRRAHARPPRGGLGEGDLAFDDLDALAAEVERIL
jgi:2-haloalkanoic acid dehalogenase type II